MRVHLDNQFVLTQNLRLDLREIFLTDLFQITRLLRVIISGRLLLFLLQVEHNEFAAFSYLLDDVFVEVNKLVYDAQVPFITRLVDQWVLALR